MKKTYIAPLTEVVKINAEQMICQSQVGVGGSVPGGQGSGTGVLGKDDEEYGDLW